MSHFTVYRHQFDFKESQLYKHAQRRTFFGKRYKHTCSHIHHYILVLAPIYTITVKFQALACLTLSYSNSCMVYAIILQVLPSLSKSYHQKKNFLQGCSHTSRFRNTFLSTNYIDNSNKKISICNKYNIT